MAAHLRRQQFLEMLAAPRGESMPEVDELVAALQAMEPLVDRAQFNDLCFLMTLSKPQDHADYAGWTVARGRLSVFTALAAALAPVYQGGGTAAGEPRLLETLVWHGLAHLSLVNGTLPGTAGSTGSVLAALSAAPAAVKSIESDQERQRRFTSTLPSFSNVRASMGGVAGAAGASYRDNSHHALEQQQQQRQRRVMGGSVTLARGTGGYGTNTHTTKLPPPPPTPTSLASPESTSRGASILATRLDGEREEEVEEEEEEEEEEEGTAQREEAEEEEDTYQREEEEEVTSQIEEAEDTACPRDPPRFVPRDLLRDDAGVRCLAHCPTDDLLRGGGGRGSGLIVTASSVGLSLPGGVRFVTWAILGVIDCKMTL